MPQMQAMSSIAMFIEQKVVPLRISKFKENVSSRFNKDIRQIPDAHATGSQASRALENVFQVEPSI